MRVCSSRLYLCGYGKADGLYGCEDAIEASCGAGGVLKVVLGGYKQRVLQLAFATCALSKFIRCSLIVHCVLGTKF